MNADRSYNPRYEWSSNSSSDLEEVARTLRYVALDIRTGGDVRSWFDTMGLHIVPKETWREIVSVAQAKADRDEARCCFPNCDGPISIRSGRLPFCSTHLDEMGEHFDESKHNHPELMDSRMRRQAVKAEIEQASRRRDVARGSQPGFVYYLEVGRRIKIGYAQDVKKRMQAYPPDATLMAVHPGTPDLEKEMHRQFSHALAVGREWFNPDPAIIDHITAVTNQFGPPDDHMHQFRKASGKRDS